MASLVASRLGPSASQFPVDDEKVSEIVRAMSLLQTTMQQPWCRELMTNLGFAPPSSSQEGDLANAKAGLPASARPVAPSSAAPAKPSTVAPAAAKSEKDEPKEALVPKLDAKTEPSTAEPRPAPAQAEPTVKPEVVNSSTHRAAHARLQRRMHSLANEAECPNAVKLWSGSRKEGPVPNNVIYNNAFEQIRAVPFFPTSCHSQEKQELLQKWIEHGENLAAIEVSLQVQRQQQQEIEHGRELLTINEMQSRGFSRSL